MSNQFPYPKFEPDQDKRFVRVSFQEIHLVINNAEEKSMHDIRLEVQERLKKHFEKILKTHTTIEKLPENVLNSDKVYIGRVVRVRATNRIAVIKSIRRTANLPVIIRYEDNTEDYMHYYDLLVATYTPDSFAIKPKIYSGDPYSIKSGDIFFINTQEQSGLCVLTRKKSEKLFKLHFFSSGNHRNTQRIEIESIHEVLSQYTT